MRECRRAETIRRRGRFCKEGGDVVVTTWTSLALSHRRGDLLESVRPMFMRNKIRRSFSSPGREKIEVRVVPLEKRHDASA